MVTLVVVMMALSLGIGFYTIIESLVEWYKKQHEMEADRVYCQLWKERAERDDLPGYNGRIY